MLTSCFLANTHVTNNNKRKMEDTRIMLQKLQKFIWDASGLEQKAEDISNKMLDLILPHFHRYLEEDSDEMKKNGFIIIHEARMMTIARITQKVFKENGITTHHKKFSDYIGLKFEKKLVDALNKENIEVTNDSGSIKLFKKSSGN